MNEENGFNMNSVIPGIGAAQLLMGGFLKKGQRPFYSPPGAAKEALSTARMLANSSVRPGDEIARGQIARSAGMSVNSLNRSINSGSQILAGVDMINKNTNQALMQNAAANTQFRFNAIQNLQNSLGNFAKYQDRQWQENQLTPYLEKARTKEMLIGSGLQNIVGGLQANQVNNQQQQYFDWLMGGSQRQAPSTRFKAQGGFGLDWHTSPYGH